MYVESFKNNGFDYLRLVESKRVLNSKGVKTARKHVILNIGPLSKFDDGKPMYMERLKQSFKSGNPIIPSLKPYCDSSSSPIVHKFSIAEGSPDCFGNPKIFSNILLEKILEELGLMYFFSSYKGFRKIKYDLYGFAKLLIFGRVLNPASKVATIKQNDEYYTPILSNYNSDNVYDTLDFVYQNKDKIIKRINTNLVKKANRSPKIIYYDVTNFYYETENPDDDILDENDNLIQKGMRKMGVCKEERKLPIVQMGLFMDDDGIPISIETFPGNTLDHLTLRPALQNSIDNLDFSRFILISDRGIFQYRNLLKLSQDGNGYIVAKSLLKSSQKERDWAYDDKGYVTVNEDFKYKSRIIKRTITDEDNVKHTIEEKVVVYWSKKFQKRAEKEDKSFFDFIKKLQDSPGSFRLTAFQNRSIKKFLKKEYINKGTGELLNSSDIKPLLDYDKIEAYKKNLGYYQIVTSELNMKSNEVIEKYHGLTQIEEQFRTMKSTLETRPIYVRTPEHIEAHLLICLVALIMIRIIQKRIISSNQIELKEDIYWTTGINSTRIQEALKKWQVDIMPNGLYRFMNIEQEDLKLILNAFNIDIPKKLFTIGELKNIKTKIKIFI